MDRRHFLSLAAGLAVWPSAAGAVSRPPRLRRLRLANANTGETFEGTYRNDNGPIDRVMEELCVFLRDHHSGEQTQIDVGVIDFLAAHPGPRTRPAARLENHRGDECRPGDAARRCRVVPAFGFHSHR